MQESQWLAVAAYLNGQGLTLAQDVVPQRLTGGAANENYLIGVDAAKAVLRRPPDGPLPPGANDVKREYRLLSSLGGQFPKAPGAIHLCTDESVIGVPFCISEFREGICIGRHLPPSLATRDGIGDALSRCIVDTLAELHRVDVAAAGLTDLGKADGYLERQINGWAKRAARVLSPQQVAKVETAKAWLIHHLPDDRPSTLVHNDFKLDNMLVDPDTLTATAVLDWDMATIGDPLYELAILLSYWGAPDDSPVYDYQCRMPKESAGWWSRQRVIDEYEQQLATRCHGPTMSFYWSLAQYRSAVVYAQLNAVFERTGEFPSSLTPDECNAMSQHVDDALEYLVTHLDTPPPWQ